MRVLLLYVFYSIRSEHLLMEQLDYSLSFRWSVAWGWMIGMEPDRKQQEIPDRFLESANGMIVLRAGRGQGGQLGATR